MQAELNSDVALSAANALLSHLRRSPEAARQPARDLAREFGLEESFVAQVLQNVTSNRRAETRAAQRRPGPVSVATSAVARTWIAATKRPLGFVFVTLLLTFGAMYAVSALGPKLRTALDSGSGAGAVNASLLTGLLMLGIAGIAFLLHMGVYFRHRSPRLALYGGLLLWICLSMVVLFGVLFGSGRSRRANDPAFFFLAGVTGMLMLSLVYAGLGSLAAVVGGWTRIKKQEREEEEMSRQDLLERYFELQARLRAGANAEQADHGPGVFGNPMVVWYRDHQPLANLAIGFCLSAFTLITMSASGLQPGQQEPVIGVWFFVVLFLGIAGLLFHVMQGYLSKSAWRAIFGALCVTAGSLLALLLPFTDLSGSTTIAEYALKEGLNFVVLAGVSCAGYLGAVVQRRSVREENLERNDQATVLAEMVRIQWKLSNELGNVCVMVVDAAKSSEMKAAADPLLVEYSFREYQEWIERISAQFGGRVHSTAGDGAVVAFETCAQAIRASRRIQTDVFRFNKDENRLPHPFRLRVGLHSGEIAGNIDEIQFTEVIDIAAHIEAVCPVGGIAATDEVVQHLPDEQFIDLQQEIDGHRVFMVANATEYA